MITKEATFKKYDGIVSTPEDFFYCLENELRCKFQQTKAKIMPLNLDFDLSKNF